jgi:hypothetical protein
MESTYLDRYLTVDYERSEFYVSQCAFQQDATEHIITIPSVNSTSANPPSVAHGHSLPTGAIVGIAVGGVLLGVILVLALLFFFKKRPFAKPQVAKPTEDPPVEMVEYSFTGKPELDSAPMSPKPATEISGMPVEYYRPDKEATSELVGTGPSTIYEMMGDTPKAQELQGTESSPNSPRSPFADRRSLMSGTVSPFSDRSDRGDEPKGRRESNLESP